MAAGAYHALTQPGIGSQGDLRIAFGAHTNHPVRAPLSHWAHQGQLYGRPESASMGKCTNLVQNEAVESQIGIKPAEGRNGEHRGRGHRSSVTKRYPTPERASMRPGVWGEPSTCWRR